MKDRELRKEIGYGNADGYISRVLLLTQDVRDLKIRVNRRLDDISIADCPKCKHPVLAQEIRRVQYYGGFYGSLASPRHIKNPAVNQCLTCGTKFSCSKECVCEIVDV